MRALVIVLIVSVLVFITLMAEGVESVDFFAEVFSPNYASITDNPILKNVAYAVIVNNDKNSDLYCTWFTTTNTKYDGIIVRSGTSKTFYFDIATNGIDEVDYNLTISCKNLYGWPGSLEKKFGPYKIKLDYSIKNNDYNNISNINDSDDDYPVIFVHGHSPMEITNGYGKIGWEEFAKQLESEGYEDMGFVLPRDALNSAIDPLWKGKKISVLTTYYLSDDEGMGDEVGTNDDMNISEYAKRLSLVVDAVKKRTGKNKVILVSHSMGGLVARTYLSYYGGDTSVDKLIMVGTPNNGISGSISFLCGNTAAQFTVGLLESIKNGEVSDFVLSPRKNTPECNDMRMGSDFLKKLNENIPKAVKYLAVVGIGENSTNCPDNGRWDGTVCESSVKLNGIETYEYVPKIHNDLLHTSMINPNISPEVYMRIVDFIRA